MDEARAEARVRSDKNAALTELSSVVDLISADGKITAEELARLRSDIERLRKA
jgi:hypothetical protein